MSQAVALVSDVLVDDIFLLIYQWSSPATRMMLRWTCKYFYTKVHLMLPCETGKLPEGIPEVMPRFCFTGGVMHSASKCPACSLLWDGRKEKKLVSPVPLTTLMAAEGSIRLLNVLRKEKPPLSCNTHTLAAAARNGHLNVLMAIGAAWDDVTLEAAAEAGQLDILKWCKAQRPTFRAPAWLPLTAAKFGQLEVLKWCSTKLKMNIPKEAFIAAAFGGQVRTICWLSSHLNYLSEKRHKADLYAAAALGKQKEFIEWLGLPPSNGNLADSGWDDLALIHAIHTGDAEFVRWLLSIEAPHTAQAYEAAVQQGSVEILNVLYDAGISFNLDCAVMAVATRHLDALIWYFEHEGENDLRIWGEAAASGRLKILEWGLTNGRWNDSEELSIIACDHDTIETLRWFFEKGLRVSTRCIGIAHEYDFYDISNLLAAHGLS